MGDQLRPKTSSHQDKSQALATSIRTRLLQMSSLLSNHQSKRLLGTLSEDSAPHQFHHQDHLLDHLHHLVQPVSTLPHQQPPRLTPMPNTTSSTRLPMRINRPTSQNKKPETAML